MTKHTIHKSLAVYEKILRSAFDITWKHKELWFLGLVAGIAYSGTIMQNIFSSAAQVQPADQVTLETLEQSTASVPYILSYARTLFTLPTGRFVITIIAVLIVLAAIVYFVVMAQHLLLTGIHRTAKRKKHLTLREIFRAQKHVHFWRIFAVDALAIIATIIVTGLLSLPLSLLLSDVFFLNFLSYMAVYAVVLPLLFGINIFAMFGLVNVVRKEDGIDKAFLRAFNAVHKHWLVAVEMALLLFLLNIGVFLVFFLGITILTLLVLPLFFAAIAAGSIVLMTILGIILGLNAALLYLVYFGAVTTFNYAAWTLLVERVEKFGAMPALEGVISKFRS